MTTHLNSGIRGGLWEKKHSDAMGSAVFLFGWLVHRQTKEVHGSGLVWRGHPFTYEEISAGSGWPVATVRTWMRRLVEKRYIEVRYTCYKQMVIRIPKAKKFGAKQIHLFDRKSTGISAQPSRYCGLNRPIQGKKERLSDKEKEGGQKSSGRLPTPVIREICKERRLKMIETIKEAAAGGRQEDWAWARERINAILEEDWRYTPEVEKAAMA